jgi:thymidylate synthase (FAD)
MLWSEGHETPFEKGMVHFLVNCDIASHIHLLKHRISSLNAESARYKELKEDKYYIPKDWNGIECSKFLPYGDCGESWSTILERYVEQGNMLYHQCIADLEPVLGRKRAKESARFFKTYNSQIQADVMFNMRSFANFQKLRNSEHAQLEIREIAAKMLECVKNIEGQPFKYTLEAWGY